jgi:hypothetical protein
VIEVAVPVAGLTVAVNWPFDGVKVTTVRPSAETACEAVVKVHGFAMVPVTRMKLVSGIGCPVTDGAT